jgi:ABC-type branched-subunit amino acid transport system ATPase component
VNAPAAASAPHEVLSVQSLNVSYGEARVLFDVHLAVRSKQIVACVGRNGAGKTTLLRSIAGFLRPASGAISCEGESLVGRRPHEVVRLGVRYVPQDKKVFSDLTVRENLELGSFATKDRNWDRVTGYFPKLRSLLDRKAGFLSGGERQMLMIARALLGSPKLLLVDEPTEGLAPAAVAQLRAVFADLARTTAIVIVEQNLPLVCAIADTVYAIKEGRVAAVLAGRDQITGEACERYC